MQPPKKKPNRMKQQNSLKHKINTNEEKTLGQVTKKMRMNKCNIHKTFINKAIIIGAIWVSVFEMIASSGDINLIYQIV